MAKAHLYKSYVTTAARLIDSYDGAIPLNDFLKKYFALHKKYGSRDRKHITHLCYCYYRLGYAAKALPVEEKILLALFLCSADTHEILPELKPQWKGNFTGTVHEKLHLAGYPFSIENIFPWQDGLSMGINGPAFAESHLLQPDLFLRIRPGQKEAVNAKLSANTVIFEDYGNGCLALFNATKIDDILTLNKEAVVQDYSSQRISGFLELMNPVRGNGQPATAVWDCCAASGGKSLLAIDVLGNMELTVSDVRPGIIQNLKKRFAEAGIKKYHSFVADLSSARLSTPGSSYDLIICDAPCSGSGTWGRTPEQLYFFTEDKIEYYSNLQKKIVQNVLPHVKKGGYFLYITCSVFKKENEEVVDFILHTSKMQLVKQEVLVGYDKRADTMFGAMFTPIP